MSRQNPIIAVLALALAGGAANAADNASATKAPEASIPFANVAASVLEWQADGDTGLWVQDATKQWYYAKMFAPCTGLSVAPRIGFKTRTADKLDRYAEVVVPNYPNCAIQSFTKSDAPTGNGKRRTGKD